MFSPENTVVISSSRAETASSEGPSPIYPAHYRHQICKEDPTEEQSPAQHARPASTVPSFLLSRAQRSRGRRDPWSPSAQAQAGDIWIIKLDDGGAMFVFVGLCEAAAFIFRAVSTQLQRDPRDKASGTWGRNQASLVLSGIGTDRPARRRPAALAHPVPGARARRVPAGHAMT